MFAPNALNRLARLYNLQSSYCDGLGQPRQASPGAILQVLQALGAPLRRLDEAEDAWRQRRQSVWQRVIEPVNVIWQNHLAVVKIRVPTQLAEAAVTYRIVFDSGTTLAGELHDDPAAQPITREVEGLHYIARRLIGLQEIPLGYHRLYLRIGGLEADSDLVCAPPRAYAPLDNRKRWGLFCPLYALHAEHSGGREIFPISAG
jgi:4-alpha-glucanotransferase